MDSVRKITLLAKYMVKESITLHKEPYISQRIMTSCAMWTQSSMSLAWAPTLFLMNLICNLKKNSICCSHCVDQIYAPLVSFASQKGSTRTCFKYTKLHSKHWLKIMLRAIFKYRPSLLSSVLPNVRIVFLQVSFIQCARYTYLTSTLHVDGRVQLLQWPDIFDPQPWHTWSNTTHVAAR